MNDHIYICIFFTRTYKEPCDSSYFWYTIGLSFSCVSRALLFTSGRWWYWCVCIAISINTPHHMSEPKEMASRATRAKYSGDLLNLNSWQSMIFDALHVGFIVMRAAYYYEKCDEKVCLKNYRLFWVCYYYIHNNVPNFSSATYWDETALNLNFLFF